MVVCDDGKLAWGNDGYLPFIYLLLTIVTAKQLCEQSINPDLIHSFSSLVQLTLLGFHLHLW